MAFTSLISCRDAMRKLWASLHWKDGRTLANDYFGRINRHFKNVPGITWKNSKPSITGSGSLVPFVIVEEHPATLLW